MEQVDSKYLSKHKKFRTDRKKLAMIFLVSAFVIAIVVFWWLKLIGITVTGEAFCGLEEHTHDETCYASEIICGFDESLPGTLPSEEATSQTEESHVHTDECYSKVLQCSKPEHKHSNECFPDKSADVESADDWLETMKDVKITDSIPENLVAVALSQNGYTESDANFEYDDEGNKNGYTRYGEWYGNPCGKWNTMFVSFCLKYSEADESDLLISAGAETMRQLWISKELYSPAEKHEAKKGEIIFIDDNDDSLADKTAIISEINDDETKIIIGDYDNSVKEISLSEETVILGYGLTHNLLTVSQAQATTLTTAPQESTTQPPVGFTTTTTENTETTESAETTEDETTDKTESSTEASHKHSDECYTSDGVLVCTQWGLSEPWALDWESDEFKDKAVKYVAYLINQLPDADEFDNKLSEYDSAGDYDGYEAYFEETYKLVCKAFVNYENLLPDLKEKVPNKEALSDFEWLYRGASTMAVTETRTVEFVNYYDNATSYKTVLIHGNRVGAYSSFGFYYWYAVIVDENEYGELVVTSMYDYKLTNKSNLKPTTEKGFVLLSHGDSNKFDCKIGDEVTVNFDYLNTSGKNTSSYGTVTFSDYVPPETTTQQPVIPDPDEPEGPPVVEEITKDTGEPNEFSDPQIDYIGGKTTSGRGDVEISKSIDGTDIENVFDITLTVRTESTVQTYLEDPDMSVVIVMDISNTMNKAYPTGTTTSRYDAAVVAAENFINQFYSETRGLSKLGFVAFNSHAHKIFDLSPCGNKAQAQALINQMKTDTKAIIGASGYADSHDRFTNVEAGLKMGYDMLASSDNQNKYIIFLSDGFPTTYYNPNDSRNDSDTYYGYDTYTSSGTKGKDGVFYDYVTGYYCSAGTSYSDKGAIRAREMATQIKALKAKIFSIGIDIGGQTISGYDNQSGLSVIDRTGTTYEIGSATSKEAYKNWLGNSIGSGYYYDSTNQTEITAAFANIFAEIAELNESSRKTIWTATDPLPVLGEDSTLIEFIYFYDKDGNPVTAPNDPKKLEGDFGVGLENTAYHENRTVFWDLKDSGYTETVSEDGNTTYYHYKLTYRVRLYNENPNFVERKIYETNGDAYLEYKTVVTADGVTDVSDNKMLHFEKPRVFGYVGEFTFSKQSNLGTPVEGAVFELTHDDKLCSFCQGNGTPVTSVSVLGPFTSQSDGSLKFTDVPSGHIYDLTETYCPEGYVNPGMVYKVKISMDNLSVYVYESADSEEYTLWTGDDVNNMPIYNTALVYVLPETGGTGTLPFTIIGLALVAFPILYSTIRRKRERRFE